MNAIPPFHSKTTPYQYLVKTNGFVLNMEITYEIPRVVPLPSLRTPRSAARSCHALHRRPYVCVCVSVPVSVCMCVCVCVCVCVC